MSTLDCPPKYSWSEIFKHRSQEDLWIVVKGKVYNVTSWITKHPGGSLILNGGGREATAIFLSCHPLRIEKMLKKYEIGEVQDYQTFYEWESDFFSVLKGRVESFMVREGLNESSKVMYMKTLFIFGCWLFLYYWSMIRGYFVAALALGFVHSHLGISIGHDGNHGSYSKSPFLNGLAACIMDFMGVSSTVWLHQHNIGHHPNCNRQEDYCKDGSDQDDPDTHSGSPFIRLAPGQPLLWYHRWQHIYVWFLLCFFAVKWLLDDIRSFVKKRYINVKFFKTGYLNLFFFVLSKLFCIFYLFFIPFYLHSFPRSLLLPFCCLTVTSYVLVLTFSVNHLSGVSIFPDSNSPTRDWARLQVETSSNFGVGSAFWTWMSGGLNYQIEHHLFPSICHVYLPRISPIVQQTCREYKIPYHTFPSYLDAFSCFYQSIKHLGKSERKSE